MRIVEATMQLHEELGPRGTTISAIAERAGVQRLTVYRHFPDETAVFQACTAHWLTLNPPPEATLWAGIDEGEARARAVLSAWYAYYRTTRRMWTVAYRDVTSVPALQQPMAAMGELLNDIGEDMLAHITPGPAGAPLAASVHHALAFSTWSSLEALGLDDTQKVDTVCRWITAVSAE